MNTIQDLLQASVERRWEFLFGLPPDSLSPEDAKLLVEADIGILSALSGQDWDFSVFLMGENAQRHPIYSQALEASSPFVAQAAAKAVVDMEARTAAKEELKAAEFSAMQVEGKQNAIINALQALADRKGVLVFPEEVKVFKAGHVPVDMIADDSMSTEDAHAMFLVARESTRQAVPMALLIEGPGVRVLVLQDRFQDFSQSIGKPVVIFPGADGINQAVQLEPDVLRDEALKRAHLEVLNRELSTQASKVDGMTAALLSYAANSQVPPKNWLRAFEYERVKLSKIAGWRDVPEEELQRLKDRVNAPDPEGASYGVIAVSNEDGKHLLHALGVDFATTETLGKTNLYVRVTDSVYQSLEPYRGEFNWELHGMSPDLEEKVRGGEPLAEMGLSWAELEAVLAMTAYELQKVQVEGTWDKPLYHREEEVYRLMRELKEQGKAPIPVARSEASGESPQP